MISRDERSFEIAEDQIRDALHRILASPEIVRAPSLGRLFQYVVNRTLLRDYGSLKEYFVGVEVFELPPDFDPKCCALVRVQAIRLRRKLERYYAESGADDPIRIDIPKGGYVARFGRKAAARAARA